MPESRDRLPRPVEIAEVFAQRRTRILGILIDDVETGSNLFGSPGQRGHSPIAVAAAEARGSFGVDSLRRGSELGRAGFGTPRAGTLRGRYLYGTPGRENTPAGSARRGRGRATNSLLPSWYPRTPLRDITAVVRAIERRRASLREVEGRQIQSPIGHEATAPGSSVQLSGAQLEQGRFLVSPNSTVGVKRCPLSVGKVPKILLDVANETAGESEFLTPQKKLLKSIDTVEKVVMEELQKLKRTPIAKKAEREKRVRTLMAMR